MRLCILSDHSSNAKATTNTWITCMCLTDDYDYLISINDDLGFETLFYFWHQTSECVCMAKTDHYWIIFFLLQNHSFQEKKKWFTHIHYDSYMNSVFNDNLLEDYCQKNLFDFKTKFYDSLKNYKLVKQTLNQSVFFFLLVKFKSNICTNI